MNNYSSLKKQNKSPFFAVVALALCVVISACVLFSRIVTYTPQEAALRIPLTESNGVTSVTAAQRPQAAHTAPRIALLSASGAQNLTANPGFEAGDENTVWQSQTSVEIFRASYENGEGQVTVNSHNGEKLLAPGTENEYKFTLKNTGNVDLDYTLQIEAYFSDGEKAIPVVARLVDYQGRYVAGSADGYVDVLELNNVSISESISAGYIAPYTLQWQWPFDGDDTYDTWLGNLAMEEDITLTIVIRTTAEYGGQGGLPDTGDHSNLLLPAVIMVASFAGLLTVLLLPKRKRRDKDAK